MNRITIIALLILAIPNVVECQSQESASAKQILADYIEAIGGREKVEGIASIEMVGRQLVDGIEHTVVKKIKKDRSLFLERRFDGKRLVSIIDSDLGVDIVPEGIFRMSSNHVTKYEYEMMIIPELGGLDEKYLIDYHGVVDLEGGIKCHEIRLQLPNGQAVYNFYNVETSLLEMTMDDRIRTRIIKYREYEGVKMPSVYIQNASEYVLEDVVINGEIEDETFEWNSDSERLFIGRWEASMSQVDGNSSIDFIELEENRSGKYGVGLIESGDSMEADFLTTQIIGWEVDGENLRLNYYDPESKKLSIQYFIVLEKGEGILKGYISDSEVKERLGRELNPVILTYKRV